jgi:lipopolysaccharide biosynthesis glycosyltransferase
LDDDIICTSSIKELYNIKLSSNEWLGVVRDKLVWRIWMWEPAYFWMFIVKYKLCKLYFNSGMMVMNLEALRKANIQEKWENLIANPLPHRRFNDQDIVNPTCIGHVKFLDLKWNQFNSIKSSSTNPPILIHYAGRAKPWKSVKVKKYSYWKKYADLSGLIDETN